MNEKQILTEYKGSYSKRLGSIAADCNELLTDQDIQDIQQVCKSIRVVDLVFDAIEDTNERASFIEAVLSYLVDHGNEVDYQLHSEVVEAVFSLGEVLRRRGTLDRFITKIGSVVSAAEVKRRTEEIRLSINECAKEGSNVADAICIAVGIQDGLFNKIFREMGAADNLLDDIIDASRDYKAGERLLKPSSKYYAVAVAEFIRRGVMIAVKYPNKLSIFKIVADAVWHYIQPERVKYVHESRQISAE